MVGGARALGTEVSLRTGRRNLEHIHGSSNKQKQKTYRGKVEEPTLPLRILARF